MADPRRPLLEKEIQLQICQYLTLRGHFFWRQNSYGIFRTDLKRHMKAHYSIPGQPDITLIRYPSGTYVGIEVKRPGEKMNENQEHFAQRCRNSGGEYHVVHSLDEVIALGF